MRHMVQKWYTRMNQANFNLENDSNENEWTCGQQRLYFL